MQVDFDALALAPCIATFGQQVTYVPGGGAPVQLLGIFNRYAAEEQIDPGSDMMVTRIRPTLTINLRDLPPGVMPCQNEGINVGGISWAIGDAKPDGFGGLVLKLVTAQS